MDTSVRFGAILLVLTASAAMAADVFARCPRPAIDTVAFDLLLLTAGVLGAETLRRTLRTRLAVLAQ
jgi:hypothetical protein